MSSEKLFSRLLAKFLLVPAVVSCFSCNFVSSMEDNLNVLDSNIRSAARTVVDDLIHNAKLRVRDTILCSCVKGNVVIIKGKSECMRKWINSCIMSSKFESHVALALNDKFENCELSLKRLNNPATLVLLKNFALGYLNSKTDEMLTEVGV